jgi:Ion channel
VPPVNVVVVSRVGYGDICPGEEMSHVGKLFLVVFVFSGLGMFCGPITSLASMWKLHIPGGLIALASVTIGVGVMIFIYFEELGQMEAIYASVITGVYYETSFGCDEWKRCNAHSIPFILFFKFSSLFLSIVELSLLHDVHAAVRDHDSLNRNHHWIRRRYTQNGHGKNCSSTICYRLRSSRCHSIRAGTCLFGSPLPGPVKTTVRRQ